ncbi:MAG: O-acetylhomoserine aminocarboxypropyltransferase/cysteine synthase [Eubacteriaceae bacterium]|jgi:O-acetylhomoserine (thiol)-lyase|nr:O-acetylhomoserine aminocarboxypropyltransferase/cysteine synthase [Eubacteriaceae bacterium]
MSNYGFNTNCVHAGYKAESGEPQVLPIVQNTTYRYYNAKDVAAMFDLESDTFMYSRIGHPDEDALEKKMAELEGGSAAVAASSGMAAIFLAVSTLCSAGDHIISSGSIYGGTFNLFGVTLKKFGIDCTFIDQNASVEDILAAAKPRTRLIFGESLANPALTIMDFEKFSAAAKQLNVPLIVDNTLATPYLCRPIEHGADIVIHATTKWADGQATSMGGIVVESGKFDWAKDNKYPEITDPDDSYHGTKFYEAFGPAAFSMKLRVCSLRDFGCCIAPMNSWLTFQGLQHLPVRMQRHTENAQALAEFLEAHPKVEWVNYPGLKSNNNYELAQKYLPDGAGGVLTFGVKGGREAGERFLENLKLTSIVVHVGDIHTCVLHPASTTHRQLTEEEQIAAGIPPELIRASVGLENIEDIKADFDQALNAAVK